MKFDSAEVQRLAQFLMDRQTHLGPDRESTWEFERDAWDDFPAAANLLKQMHARITEMEAARIAYASEFPVNADGDPDVGSIHANIRKLKAELAAAKATNLIPSNPGELETSTPWYPDDSGEWVEVPEDLMEMPDRLLLSSLVEVLLKAEREDQYSGAVADFAANWNWGMSVDRNGRIVAYKVVKP